MAGEEANGGNGGAAGSEEQESVPEQDDPLGASTQTNPQGQPATSSGGGLLFSGNDTAGQSVGKNGIQMKWPEHPGEYGLKGAEKHKRWKNDIKAVMHIKGIDEKTAAILTQMYAQKHAKKMLERI